MIKYLLPLTILMAPSVAFAGAPSDDVVVEQEVVEVNPYEGMEVVLYDFYQAPTQGQYHYTNQDVELDTRYLTYREVSQYEIVYNGVTYVNRVVDIIEEAPIVDYSEITVNR